MSAVAEMGTLVDKIFALREKQRELEDKKSVLEKESSALQEQLIVAMKAQKLELVRGKRASFSCKEEDQPVIDNWPKFEAWMVRSKSWYLLQKRLAPAAVKEVAVQRGKKPIPGIVFVSKDVTRLTKVN